MSLLDVLTAGPFNSLYVWSIIAATSLTYREGTRRGWRPEAWLAALTAWILGGVIGSVILSWAVNGTLGGKTAVGAVAGSMLALALASRVLRLPAASAMDTLAISIPVGAAIVRLGCFVAGCCSGAPTDLPWAETHPVQLYDAGLSALLAIVLHARRDRFKSPGSAALAMVAGLAAIRFTVQFVRESHAGAVGLDFVQWAMLGILFAIVVCLATRMEGRVVPMPARRDPEIWRVVLLSALVTGVALVASRWLSPLETAVAFMVACVATLAAAARVRSALPASAPIGAVAVLALQQAPPTDTARARRYIEVGIGRSQSEYLFNRYESGPATGESCAGPPILDYDRKHRLVLNGISAGYIVDSAPGRTIAVRGQLFHGEDRMSAAVVRVGSASRPLAHSEGISGGGIAFAIDRSWIGLTAGLAGGSWPSVSEEQPIGGGSSTLGIFALRVGWLSRAYLEVEHRGLGAAALELPISHAGFAVFDKRGDRIRVGGSQSGPYGEATVVINDGLRVSMLAAPGDARAFRVMLQQQFEVGRR